MFVPIFFALHYPRRRISYHPFLFLSRPPVLLRLSHCCPHINTACAWRAAAAFRTLPLYVLLFRRLVLAALKCLMEKSPCDLLPTRSFDPLRIA